jgi:hypothetical protein
VESCAEEGGGGRVAGGAGLCASCAARAACAASTTPGGGATPNIVPRGLLAAERPGGEEWAGGRWLGGAVTPPDARLGCSGCGTPATNGEVMPMMVFCEIAPGSWGDAGGGTVLGGAGGAAEGGREPATGVWGGATRSAPHAPQNESAGLQGVPQLGQRESTVIARDTLAN